MKIIINKEELLNTLQMVQGPALSKQNFPTLSNILINIKNNKIKFTTTDLDTTIIVEKEIKAIDNGDVCVPIKRLLPIIRELPSANIVIEKNKNILLIKCENIEFKINTLNSEDFPKIKEKQQISLIKISSQNIEEMIQETSFSVGHEDSNYVLNGILFEVFRDKINLVSSDGRRLSFSSRKLPPTQPELDSKISFIIPIKAVQEIIRNLQDEGNVSVLFNANQVLFDIDGILIATRIIEGEFPNYNQVIPKQKKKKSK